MPHELTPEQRTLRARLGAHSLHATITDETAHTAPARKAFLDKFVAEVDPDGQLPEAERERRAAHAHKAYMARLAFESARIRAARKGAS